MSSTRLPARNVANNLRTSQIISALVISLFASLTAFSSAHAQVLTNLALFPNDASLGAFPNSPLTEGLDGNLYGTAQKGPGKKVGGEVFQLTLTGNLAVTYDFNNLQSFPFGPLLLQPDGSLVGANELLDPNGYGTMYQITPSGQFTSLATFSRASGVEPQDLVTGPNGDTYGVTWVGGHGCIDGRCGTVFHLAPDGRLSSLVDLPKQNRNGWGLTLGSDGNFYGTSYAGGDPACPKGCGSVFKVTPGGTLTTLLAFNRTNGMAPSQSLVEGTDGNFYGATQGDLGTIFRVTPSGQSTVLHVFNNTDGRNPAAMVLGSDGNLYGVTEEGGTFGIGTAFKITLQGVFTSLVSFTAHANGSNPLSLMQASDGNFYGTTLSGYGLAQDGTIFKLDVGLTPSPRATKLFRGIRQ